MIIMSYNIRYAGDEKTEGINSWNNRKELVAGMIRFHHPDLIGIQEALINQLEDLEKLLPEYEWVGAGRDDGKSGGEFSAILYRKDRFKVIDNSTIWLSETPDTPSIGWDAHLPRIVTWAKLEDNKTNKIFFHYNTHFSHVSEEARKNSAALIRQKVNSLNDYAVIITGDFNFRSDSEAYKIMTDKSKGISFYDAQTVSKHGHYGSDISFNGFGKDIQPGNKIDFIFVNDKVAVNQHGIIGETFNGQFPSDHMPVISEIKLK